MIFFLRQLGIVSFPHYSWPPSDNHCKIYGHNLFVLGILPQAYTMDIHVGAPVGGESLLLCLAFDVCVAVVAVGFLTHWSPVHNLNPCIKVMLSTAKQIWFIGLNRKM